MTVRDLAEGLAFLGIVLLVGSSTYLRGRADESPLSHAEYAEYLAETMPWHSQVALTLSTIGLVLMIAAMAVWAGPYWNGPGVSEG